MMRRYALLLLMVLLLAACGGKRATPAAPTAAPQPAAPTAAAPAAEAATPVPAQASPELSPLGGAQTDLSPLAQPTVASTLDLDALQQAVRADLDQRLTAFLKQGIKELVTRETGAYADGRSAFWKGVVTPAACPLVSYLAAYDGVFDGGAWELFEADGSLTSLARAWATAASAAHDGAATIVPGLATEREISADPNLMPEILQAALDEPDNQVVRATAGFYLCITDAEGFGSLAGEGLARMQELAPQVRAALGGGQ